MKELFFVGRPNSDLSKVPKEVVVVIKDYIWLAKINGLGLPRPLFRIDD